MQTLTYGFKKPQVTDKGPVVFPALEANWQQVNDHNHDGANSALISPNSILPSQIGNAGKFLTTNGSILSWATVTGAGEVNTASNVGGGVGLFKQKSGVDLEFKTLVAGANFSITPVGDTLVLAASGGGVTAGIYAKATYGFPNVALVSATHLVTYDTTVYDSDGIITLATGKIKIPLTYAGTAKGVIIPRLITNSGNGMSDLHTQMRVYKNDVFYDYAGMANITPTHANLSIPCDPVYFEGVAGDEFDFRFYNESNIYLNSAAVTVIIFPK